MAGDYGDDDNSSNDMKQNEKVKYTIRFFIPKEGRGSVTCQFYAPICTPVFSRIHDLNLKSKSACLSSHFCEVLLLTTQYLKPEPSLL
jgi:hypothetical protein